MAKKEPLFCQSLEFWRWEGGLGFRYSKRFPLNLPVSVTVTFSDGALWGKPTSVLTNFNFRSLEWGLQNTGNQNSFFSRCLFSRCHKKTLDALNCNCLNNLTDKWDTVYWLSTLQVNTRLFSCVYKGDGLIKTISYRQPNEVWTIREKPCFPQMDIRDSSDIFSLTGGDRKAEGTPTLYCHWHQLLSSLYTYPITVQVHGLYHFISDLFVW